MSEGSQRIDKWLWFARLAKSRTLAADLVTSGRIRINRVKAAKPSAPVKPGDVITSSIRGRIKVVRIVDVGHRRGPAKEAVGLYDDLTPPQDVPMSQAGDKARAATVGSRVPGSGRPTKRDRRMIDRWRSQGGG